MHRAVHDAVKWDSRSGRTSLLIASSRTEVTILNTRARLDRIHHGAVQPSGPNPDRWHPRRCRRRHRHAPQRPTPDQPAGTKFVQNGDTWTVSRQHRNGDLTVTHQRHGHRVRLPHAYVSDHVELGYATTTAQAQGRTVDTGHVLVDETTNREALYVAATRARTHTRLYVTTERPLLARRRASAPPHHRTATSSTARCEQSLAKSPPRKSGDSLLSDDAPGRRHKPQSPASAEPRG